jgi:lipoate-protein ligase A
VRLLDLGSLPPLHTQAVYHLLAEQMTAEAPDTVVLCRPAGPYLCLGFHQRRSDVLDMAAARARGLPVVRRRVGGGLTYLDPDQVFYQFVFHHRRVPVVPDRLYEWLLGVPVAALGRLGVAAELRRTNEIEVGPRRIAGIGAGRLGEATVVVGNILVDFDYDAMSAVWPSATPGFRELASAAVRERVTTLRGEGNTATPADVEAALREVLAERLGREVVPGALTERESAALDPVAARLTDPDFLALYEDEPARRSVPRLKISARAYLAPVHGAFDALQLRGALLLHDEVIVEARLSSTPARDWAPVQQALAGHPFAEWEERVQSLL